MKSSFSRRDECHSENWHRNANAKFDYYVLEKSFSRIDIYVHIYEELFSKRLYPNMALPLPPRLRQLSRFGKELFKYT